MIRIFFDVDGVLIEGFHYKPERRRRWDIDLEKDLGINRDHFQEIFSGWFLKVMEGKLHFETELERWLQAHGYKVKAQQVIDYWHAKDAVINRPVYDVVEKLAALNDIRIYTATNQSAERAAYLCDVLGFGAHFTDFYYSARIGCLKSNPDYFAYIERELGFDPYQERPLYFDDDPRNIAVSQERGWDAFLVDGPEDIAGHPRIQKLLS